MAIPVPDSPPTLDPPVLPDAALPEGEGGTPGDAPGDGPPIAPWRRRAASVWHWVRARESVLWWLHSLYALAFGVGVMWLGSRNYAWLRITYAYIAFIWATSLLLPQILAHRRVPPRWRPAVRLVATYFQKNFYQQLLFFVLPVYWASTSGWSLNVWFVALVAVSATLASLDLVYDRHLAVKRPLTALFFGFNLFACANVVLPVLWSLNTVTAMRASGVLALAGFVTLLFGVRRIRHPRAIRTVAAAGVFLALLVEVGRPLIPPAPLRLVDPVFGTALQRTPPRVRQAVPALPDNFAGRLYVITPIWAPLGLKDRVRHRWRVDGRDVHASAFYSVMGGRAQGYRLWTSYRLPPLRAGSIVAVHVETEGGQLIGRATLRVQ